MCTLLGDGAPPIGAIKDCKDEYATARPDNSAPTGWWPSLDRRSPAPGAGPARLSLCRGHTWRSWAICPGTYLAAGPDIIRHILVVNHQNYQRPGIFRRLESLIGNGLFLSTGQSWLRQRRLMQPAFHRKRLSGMAGAIVGTVDAALDTWIAQKQINIDEALMCMTLSIAFRLLLNRDEHDQDVVLISACFREAVNYLVRRLKQFVEWPVPSRARRRYHDALQGLDARVYALIAERRTDSHEHDDLLGILLAARDEETGQGMSDRELRGEVLTMLLAGHETTATSAS